MEQTVLKISQVVVLYLNDDQVIRPPARPIASPYKDIMSCFSFLFLGVPRHCETEYLRVRGRGVGSNSCGANLLV